MPLRIFHKYNPLFPITWVVFMQLLHPARIKSLRDAAETLTLSAAVFLCANTFWFLFPMSHIVKKRYNTVVI